MFIVSKDKKKNDAFLDFLKLGKYHFVVVVFGILRLFILTGCNSSVVQSERVLSVSPWCKQITRIKIKHCDRQEVEERQWKSPEIVSLLYLKYYCLKYIFF